MNALPVTELAPMMREHYRAMRDKSYRRHPVGQEWARYMRTQRWAGQSPHTLDSYEIVGSRLATDHADFHGLEQFASPVGTEYLREFLDRHWGDASTATRAARLAALRAFFKWAAADGRISYDPTAPIRSPRRRSRERSAYPAATLHRLISMQPQLREQVALELLCWLGLRKDELRVLKLQDVDLIRDLVTVQGKGGVVHVMPIGFAALRGDLAAHMQERQPGEYLLYPKHDPTRPMTPSAVHRWFKRCLTAAGLPDSIEIHELRHSAGDAIWRATGNLVLAQKLLRHESVGTTQTYLHPTREDLRAGLAAVEKSWETNQ